MSSLSLQVQVADFSDSIGASSRAARRFLINPEVLKRTKICAGDVLALTSPDYAQGTSAFSIGIAWPSYDVDTNTVYATASHLLSAEIKDGDKVQLHPLSTRNSPPGLPTLKNVRDARNISLKEDTATNSQTQGEEQRRDWLVLLLRETLVDLKYVSVGNRLQIHFERRLRQFTVVSASAGESGTDEDSLPVELSKLSVGSRPTLWTAGWDTQLSLQRPDTSHRQTAQPLESDSAAARALDGYRIVGGLDKQISQIRDLIEIPLTRPDLFRHFGLKPPKGILLHGPPGTGKTHLARAIVASTRSSVIVVNGSELSSVYHGETESKLRDVFKEARSKSPCIVVLDEVDALCPRREEGSGGEVEKRVVATLLTILDGMDYGDKSNPGDDEERVVVIGTTNRPNAIDPALRRPGRFDREIEIGIPDALARHSILQVLLLNTPHKISEENLRSVASRTHGYVGADLSSVVREAGTVAIKRWLSAPGSAVSHLPTDGTSPMWLTSADLEAGLLAVQPSAMREVFIETPQVRWSDIGGQRHVKQKLQECIEWPLLHPAAFERLGVRPPKGVLLYGPPGCSKTLTAKALATESGINFIAVKGPELLNKFVGESERAVREIFRKARAASPSIVFFDEIDALGTARAGSEGGGAGSHEGVLTTLLNEMDGVQELVGVTVVAATNRPDVIDSALMRPGRLDRILYVGPPDHQGRVDILRIRTSKMAVDPDLDLAELASLTDGCSGAEISALCQDAALWTMQDNMDALYVSHAAFVAAAKAIRRQITPQILTRFEQWREKSGLKSA